MRVDEHMQAESTTSQLKSDLYSKYLELQKIDFQSKSFEEGYQIVANLLRNSTVYLSPANHQLRSGRLSFSFQMGLPREGQLRLSPTVYIYQALWKEQLRDRSLDSVEGLQPFLDKKKSGLYRDLRAQLVSKELPEDALRANIKDLRAHRLQELITVASESYEELDG